MKLSIRNEQPADHRAVEELTKKAFWNVNVPGCDEHYLVHILRQHQDFIPELDLVAVADGKIIGNVIYTKAKLIDDDGNEMEILTFGPLSVLPEYQRQGVGKALLEESFQRAKKMGFSVIVIFGDPDNYISRGFKSSRKFNIYVGDHSYPSAMQVLELIEGTLSDRKPRKYMESPAYEINEAAAAEFDKDFEPMEPAWRPSQEMFYILSHSSVREK